MMKYIPKKTKRNRAKEEGEAFKKALKDIPNFAKYCPYS